MAIRGIFHFHSVEIADAKLSGCQELSLRSRAQAMIRSHSDTSLEGWYACRDKDCSCILGPLDNDSFSGEIDREISSERTCPVCGTTISMSLRIVYASLRVLSSKLAYAKKNEGDGRTGAKMK